MQTPVATSRPAFNLFLVSGLVLFLELACIRWFPAHVLYLTFFTNAVMLAAFVGMSIGCLLAERPRRLIRYTPFLLLVAVVMGLLVERIQLFLTQTVQVGNQSNPDVIFFGAEAALNSKVNFRLPLEFILAVFFVLIALAMIGPGQEMGRAFNEVTQRGKAYTVNLLGSMIGIVLFALISLFQLPPVVWFGLVAIGLWLVMVRQLQRVSLLNSALLLLPTVLIIGGQRDNVNNSPSMTQWSPYYRIDFIPKFLAIRTNLIGHQQIETREGASVESYALPHVLRRDLAVQDAANAWPPFKRVLIIGAGSGNDLSRAMQWCPSDARIDAVEIDPVIQKLGVEHHPDKPYADPRVTVHLNDGRNFLRRAPDGEYDLVIFALIDSLVLQTGYSNLRLESYLFTQESFRDVRRVLKPTGVAAVYNYFRQGWLVARMFGEIENAFGTPPLLLTNPPKDRIKINQFDAGFSVFIAGSDDTLKPMRRAFEQTGNSYWFPWASPVRPEMPNGFRKADDQPPPLSREGFEKPKDTNGNIIEPHWLRFRLATLEEVPADLIPATDDWPFLYTRAPLIPQQTIRGVLVMLVLSLALWWLGSRWAGSITATQTVPREWGLIGRSFFLGAGFMLVETKAIVHMALLFGGTWIVNTIVFATILMMSLLGNLIAMKFRPQNLTAIYVLLFLSLALNIAIPIEYFLGLSPTLQIIGACFVSFLPVTCAGVIFASSFARSQRPNEMFGANVAGALVGGVAENLSMLLGFRYLLFVAIAFYALSSFGAAKRSSSVDRQ